MKSKDTWNSFQRTQRSDYEIATVIKRALNIFKKNYIVPIFQNKIKMRKFPSIFFYLVLITLSMERSVQPNSIVS